MTMTMYWVGQNSDSRFNYINIMLDKLQNIRCLYCLNNFYLARSQHKEMAKVK